MRHRSTTLGNWKVILGTGLLAGGLSLLVGVPGAKADDCQERIARADHRIHEAIEHHGYDSGAHSPFHRAGVRRIR